MDQIINTLINIIIFGGIGLVFLVLMVFAVYWFELDTLFLKRFEPIFRKLTNS